jgi:hypothetical protein
MKMLKILPFLILSGCTASMMANYNCKVQRTQIIPYPGGSMTYLSIIDRMYCDEVFPASGNIVSKPKTSDEIANMPFGQIHQ